MSSSAADAANNSKKRSRNTNGNSVEVINDSVDLLGLYTPADDSSNDRAAGSSSNLNSKKQKKVKEEEEDMSGFLQDQEMMFDEEMMVGDDEAFLMGPDYIEQKESVKNIKDTLLDKDFYNDFGDDFDDDDLS